MYEKKEREREGGGGKGGKGGNGNYLWCEGSRDGGKSTLALGCKAVVIDSVAHGNSVFFVHGLPTETQMVKRKSASNESLIFFCFRCWCVLGKPGEGGF